MNCRNHIRDPGKFGTLFRFLSDFSHYFTEFSVLPMCAHYLKILLGMNKDKNQHTNAYILENQADSLGDHHGATLTSLGWNPSTGSISCHGWPPLLRHSSMTKEYTVGGLQISLGTPRTRSSCDIIQSSLLFSLILLCG